MSRRAVRYVGWSLAAILMSTSSASGDESAARSTDEQAIRQAAAAYLAALAKGDAKAVVDFWTADGELVDGLGQVHQASELAKAVAGRGASPDTLRSASEIRFVAPDVAIERGASEVAAHMPGGAAAQGQFQAVWVKRDGRWQLASVCELPAAPSSANLKDLEWMIGRWSAEIDGTRLETVVQWNATGTYLLRDSSAIRDSKAVLRSSQRIGLDPLTGELKSWSFDSDGGRSEAGWTREGDSWIGQTAGVLADGRQSTSTVILTPGGRDAFDRKVIAGRVQGEPIADQLVRYKRLSEKK